MVFVSGVRHAKFIFLKLQTVHDAVFTRMLNYSTLDITYQSRAVNLL